MTAPRRVVAAVPLAAVLLVSGLWTAGGADAGWLAAGTGSGRAGATTLTAVTGVAAGCSVGSATVTVSWAASPPATSYVVQRQVNGGTSTTVATTSALSYPDTVSGLVSASVRWRVVGRLGAWVAPASAATAAQLVSMLGVCL